MTVNRKEFLALVATGAAGAAFVPRRLFAGTGTASTEQTVPAGYSPSMFNEYVGTTFQVTARGRSMAPVDVVLQAVADRGDSARTVQFSLEFLALSGDPLESQAYDFDHATLGTLPIFVSPSRRDGQGRGIYRADFNLLKDDPAQNERSTVIVPPRRRT